MFCGIKYGSVSKLVDVILRIYSPGVMSAETGHHFASPTNHFWRALHQGGLVQQFVPASEDYTLPEKYNLGMTNLVDRPSAEAAELSAKEMLEGAPAFLDKVATWRPRIICFVGKGIWLAVQKNLDSRIAAAAAQAGREKTTKPKDAFDYGLQPYTSSLITPIPTGINRTLIWVMPSTSGRVVSHQLVDKIKLFSRLKQESDADKAGTLDTSQYRSIQL
ncbi:DNA glycosylase [Calocera viscosa TUFC12733]|uniref:DNA glycosylase n=1 Tax=Calocera viscosa (strain TUFC12733) TaxID=1330018 RepID=A0A167HVH8_CALVF|nr:DNA glycosylase [Calocera viscosa TUFC12733]